MGASPWRGFEDNIASDLHWPYGSKRKFRVHMDQHITLKLLQEKVRSSIKNVGSPLVYLIVICSLALWWTLAFKAPFQQAQVLETSDLEKENSGTAFKQPSVEKRLALFSFSREALKDALNGDIVKIASFLAEWDLDARLMQQYGHATVKWLSEETYLRAQYLAKHYATGSADLLTELESLSKNNLIVDERGKQIAASRSRSRFLPQTYVSASFLLALLPSQQIIALPKGFREQVHLYPIKSTEKIPMDMDPFNMEKIFSLNPELAFVARYSHASTLQSLHSQNIALYMTNDGNSIEEIRKTLRDIGIAVNQPLKAELLDIFMEGALYAIDNALALHYPSAGNETLLFLNHALDFSIPSSGSVTMELIKRLPFQLASVESDDKEHGSSVPVSREEIVKLNPNHLLIATNMTDMTAKLFEEDLAFQETRAHKKGQISRVDFSIQQTPAQYIVLAYYDIAQALMNELSR
jgi:iron complex transport system substrate-binding protein